MSALRQPESPSPGASGELPGFRAEALPGEEALRIAARCLTPGLYAVLQVITHLRSLPDGQAVEWREVTVQCDLFCSGKDPLKSLRPYVGYLVGILHVGTQLAWNEIAEHPWVKGVFSLDTLYNKRRSIKLPGGKLTLADWIKRYKATLEEEQQRILSQFAAEDRKRIRKLLQSKLARIEARDRRITAQKQHEAQLGLGLGLPDETDPAARAAALAAIEAGVPVTADEANSIDRTISRELKLALIDEKDITSAAKINRELRLINDMEPDHPGGPGGRELPRTPAELAQLESELDAELASLAEEEELLAAELGEDGEADIASTGPPGDEG